LLTKKTMLLTIDDIVEKLSKTYELNLKPSQVVHHVWDVLRDLPDYFFVDEMSKDLSVNGRMVQAPIDTYKVRRIVNLTEKKDWTYNPKTNRIEFAKTYVGTLKIEYCTIPIDENNYPYIPEDADKAILAYILGIQVQMKVFKSPVISTRSDKLLGWYEGKYRDEISNLRTALFDLQPDEKKTLLKQ